MVNKSNIGIDISSRPSVCFARQDSYRTQMAGVIWLLCVYCTLLVATCKLQEWRNG